MEKRNKGFTLTELIIVIVIIGILAGVLIPTLTGYVQKAKKSAAEQDAESIMKTFIATASNEYYGELVDKNFIVLKDDYYVVFEKGGLKESFEVGKVYTVTNKNNDNQITKDLDAIGNSDYIYLTETSAAFDNTAVPTATKAHLS